MQFQEMAYTIGKKLSLPVINFDTCIAHALCVCECPAKDVMLATVNEIYENYIKNTQDLEGL